MRACAELLVLAMALASTAACERAQVVTPGPSASAHGEVDLLWIRGEIETAAATPTVELDHFTFMTRRSGPWTASWRPEMKADDPYRVRLLDGAANVLAEASCRATFSVELPSDPRARAVVVTDASGNVLARRDASPHKPRIEIVAPRPNTVVSGTALELEWKASDADGDSLRSDVRYSADGGATWTTLVLEWSEQKLSYGGQLEGGKQAYVEVTVSDGFWVVRERSGPFSMPLHPPAVEWLIGPNRRYARGESIHLEARASDVEDGARMVQEFVFSSSLDGELGRGRWLVLNASDLQSGLHTLTASARDSDGVVGTATTTISIGD